MRDYFIQIKIAFLFIFIFTIGLTEVVDSNGKKSPALEILGIDYVSNFEYLGFDVNNFVYDYPVELEIRVKNNDSTSKNKLMVSCALKFDYRTRGGGRKGASGYEKGRFTFMSRALPAINPKKKLKFKFKSKPMKFEEPPIDNTAILLLQISDVEKNQLIYETSSSVNLITRSVAEDQIRAKLTFWIVIATFCISLITMAFSWRKKAKNKESTEAVSIVQNKATDKNSNKK